MDINRRGFIIAALAAAFTPVAAGAAAKWGKAAASAAPMLRPEPVVASSPICARCGRPGHTALDPACPLNGENWAAIQSAARRRAAQPGDGTVPGGADVSGGAAT
jgi:hypothetical protein